MWGWGLGLGGWRVSYLGPFASSVLGVNQMLPWYAASQFTTHLNLPDRRVRSEGKVLVTIFTENKDLNPNPFGASAGWPSTPPLPPTPTSGRVVTACWFFNRLLMGSIPSLRSCLEPGPETEWSGNTICGFMSHYTAARDFYSACFTALRRVLHHCLMVFLTPAPAAFVSVLSIYTVP